LPVNCSLVIAFLIVGILINVYRQGHVVEEGETEWVLRRRITPRV